MASRWALFFETRADKIAQAVFLAEKFSAQTEPDTMRRINRVRLAMLTGWTLEYIDNLDPFTLNDFVGVIKGDRAAHK